jgi:hypothetical protein
MTETWMNAEQRRLADAGRKPVFIGNRAAPGQKITK